MASINDYVREFEKVLRLYNNRQSTIDTYTSIVKMFLLHHKKDPKVITRSQIEDYILTLNSTRHKRQCIYTLMKFYYRVLKQPDTMKDFPIPKQEKFIPEILNYSEVERLIAAIPNLKQKACMQLIYSCGLRIGEAVNIKVSDVDGQRLQLKVRQAKGGKDRLVPIPAATLHLLRSYYAQYKPAEYLFAGQMHAQYDVRSIQQTFHRAKKAAGIRKRVTVHSLRHSRATHLIDNGVDMSMIQKFLGHSNIKTTVDFYLHTSIVTMQNIFAAADQRTVSYPLTNTTSPAFILPKNSLQSQ